MRKAGEVSGQPVRSRRETRNWRGRGSTSLAGPAVAEVSRAAGLAPPTAHRLLTTLQQEHFAQLDAKGRGEGWPPPGP